MKSKTFNLKQMRKIDSETKLKLAFLVMFICWCLVFVLISVINTPEQEKQIKKTIYEYEEAQQRYPWNCTDGEIEYFESLIELQDEKN